VTARRGPHGGLRLASWKKGGAKLGVAKAGEIQTLGRPHLADTLMVPVILACSERLRLIAWTEDSAGQFTRTGDSGNKVGAVSRVSCAHIGGKWATAVRDGSGRLKVIFWEMEQGAPKRLGDSGSNGPEIIDVDVAGLSFNDVDFGGVEPEWRVVTAVRTKASKLRLQTWAWKKATGQVTLVDDSTQKDQISLLRLLHLANDRFVTVVRDNATAKEGSPGHLKLITWSIT
jgi:hypothetical protein